jgi:hypothetical protein
LRCHPARHPPQRIPWASLGNDLLLTLDLFQLGYNSLPGKALGLLEIPCEPGGTGGSGFRGGRRKRIQGSAQGLALLRLREDPCAASGTFVSVEKRAETKKSPQRETGLGVGEVRFPYPPGHPPTLLQPCPAEPGRCTARPSVQPSTPKREHGSHFCPLRNLPSGQPGPGKDRILRMRFPGSPFHWYGRIKPSSFSVPPSL